MSAEGAGLEPDPMVKSGEPGVSWPKAPAFITLRRPILGAEIPTSRALQKICEVF